jgi:branched-chain amino acid transport system substrate-binding protein
MPVTHHRHMTRRRASVLSSVALLASGLLLAGCGGGSNSGGGSDTYTLGYITGTQGLVAEVGKSFLRGAQLAESEINKDGYVGDGAKIKLKTAEGQEVPAASISAARKLLTDKNVLGLLCCVASPTAQSVTPVAAAAKAPVIIYGATLPGLEDPSNAYRSSLIPQAGNEALAKAFIDAYKPSSVAYVVAADNNGMVSQLDAFKKPFKADATIKDLGTTNTQLADTDFNGPASAVIAKHPDVVVLSTIANPEAGLIKTLRDRGYKGQILANVTISPASLFKATGKSLVGIPFPSEYVPASENPRSKAFTAAFTKKFGVAPDLYASQGYENVYYAAAALKAAAAAGSVDRASFTKALNNVHSMDTMWGPVNYDDKGQAEAQKILFATHDADGQLVEWKPSP